VGHILELKKRLKIAGVKHDQSSSVGQFRLEWATIGPKAQLWELVVDIQLAENNNPKSNKMKSDRDLICQNQLRDKIQ